MVLLQPIARRARVERELGEGLGVLVRDRVNQVTVVRTLALANNVGQELLDAVHCDEAKALE